MGQSFSLLHQPSHDNLIESVFFHQAITSELDQPKSKALPFIWRQGSKGLCWIAPCPNQSIFATRKRKIKGFHKQLAS
jgi:hypothetical protein